MVNILFTEKQNFDKDKKFDFDGLLKLKYWSGLGNGEYLLSEKIVSLLESNPDMIYFIAEFYDFNLAINLLKKLSISKNNKVREAVADTLGQVYVKESVPILKDLLNDKFWVVRQLSTKSLGKLKAKEAISEIKKNLFSNSFPIRAATIKTLGQLDNKSSISEIRKQAKHGMEDVRQSVAEALSSMNAIEGIPELKNLLLKDSVSPKVRKEAAEALGIIRAEDAAPALIKLLEDNSFIVRDSALTALFRIKESSSTSNEIKNKINYSLLEFNKKIQEKINDKEIFNIIKSDNSDLKIVVIKGLESSKNKEIISYLVGLLSDKNIDIQKESAILLCDLDQHETIPALTNWLYRKSSEIDIDTKNYIKAKLQENGETPYGTLSYFLKKAKFESKKTSGIYIKLINKYKASTLEKKIVNIFNNTHERTLIDNYQIYKNNFIKDTNELEIHKLSKFALINEFIRQSKFSRADPAPFIYEYAYAIANMDEAEGIKLLGHNLAKVREAAARGLANSDFLGVPLLQKLEQEWLATDNPITRQGLFHAIDIALLAIEGIGADKELEALKTYEPTLTNEHSAASIKPRVEWTRIQLQWRVDALKELRELADRQLPGLLKEYCLNPDGTDMKPEECTIER